MAVHFSKECQHISIDNNHPFLFVGFYARVLYLRRALFTSKLFGCDYSDACQLDYTDIVWQTLGVDGGIGGTVGGSRLPQAGPIWCAPPHPTVKAATIFQDRAPLILVWGYLLKRIISCNKTSERIILYRPPGSSKTIKTFQLWICVCFLLRSSDRRYGFKRML